MERGGSGFMETWPGLDPDYTLHSASGEIWRYLMIYTFFMIQTPCKMHRTQYQPRGVFPAMTQRSSAWTAGAVFP